GFAHTLRDNGFKVGLAETGDALNILTSPNASTPTNLKPALRALFCATHSDWERFDEIFDAFWRGQGMRQARVLAGAKIVGKSRAQRRGEPGERGAEPNLPDHVTRGDREGDIAADPRGRREGASRAETLAATDMRHIVDPADIARTHAL